MIPVYSKYGSCYQRLLDAMSVSGTVRRAYHALYIKPFYRMIVKAFLAQEKACGTPMFHSVEIETMNRCNGTCAFCPANRNADIRPFRRMDSGLFRGIIDQLRELDYKGNVGLYSNNEPFLDERMPEFARYAKTSLPGANICLYTNGTVLSLETYKETVPYLDHLHIDNYDDGLKLIGPVKAIVDDSVADTRYDGKVVVHLRKPGEVLFSRGGQAPNKGGSSSAVRCPCLYPFQQMVIRPDGKVSLCCNDVYGRYTLGDANHESLYRIWVGAGYEGIRRKIATSRDGIELCCECDTVSGWRRFRHGKWDYVAD